MLLTVNQFWGRGMRTGKRGLTTAAVTVVCAITVLAAPGTAFADPGPSASPSPSTSPGGPGASAAPGATPGKDLEAVRKKLDRLYRAAASATEEYNAAEEKADKQNAEIVELAKKIVKGQEKLDGLKDRAAAAARAQYRTGGLPDGAKLVLSDDPEDFLDGTGRVIQGQRAAKGLLGPLTRAQGACEPTRRTPPPASRNWRRTARPRPPPRRRSRSRSRRPRSWSPSWSRRRRSASPGWSGRRRPRPRPPGSTPAS
ncbi:hypothetical protein STENM36S_03308 [Streptomyces tendae]